MAIKSYPQPPFYPQVPAEMRFGDVDFKEVAASPRVSVDIMNKGIKRPPIGPSKLETTASLAAKGVSTRRRQKEFIRLSKGIWLHRAHFECPRDAFHAGAEGKIQKPIDIRILARAEHLARPGRIITGWAALAYYGLKYWADEAELSVISHEGRARTVEGASNTATGGTGNSTKVRSENIQVEWTCRPDAYFPELRCVDLIEALISALQTVKKRTMVWKVPSIKGLNEDQVRGIELLDAVRRIAPMECDLDELRERAQGRIHHRWLAKVIRASDAGADSPMETRMRLLIDGIRLGDERLEWESQVSIMRDGRLETECEQGELAEFVPWLTVADLYCAKYKIVLFYDGEHHREKGQYFRDMEINATLQEYGYVVLRVTAAMLQDPHDLRRRIAKLALSVQESLENDQNAA